MRDVAIEWECKPKWTEVRVELWYLWAVMLGVLTALALENRRILTAVRDGNYSYALGTPIRVRLVTVPLSLLFWYLAR